MTKVLARALGLLTLAALTASTAAAGQVLLAVDRQGNVFDVDPATGQTSNPRATMAELVGVAFGPDGMLYAASTDFAPVVDSFFRVDPATGATTLLTHLGVPDVEEGDLATHPLTGDVYVMGSLHGLGGVPEMLRVDVDTAVVTVVGEIPNPLSARYPGLSFDATGRLWALRNHQGSSQLVELGPSLVVLSSTPLSVDLGTYASMDRDPLTGTIYVVGDPQPSGPNTLYQLDTATAQLTAVGPTGVAEIVGLSFGFDAPTTYCTGKLNSQGCVPFISTEGVASTSSTSPFRILAADVIDGNFGFLVYGYAKSNLNFHGGKLCVKAPLERLLPPKFAKADGLPPCRGILRRNFNPFVQSGTDPLLTAGQTVFAQWFQRDAADPAGFGDSLSDGVRFTLAP